MKITCTVKEFGLIVRGCAKSSCYNCPLTDVCNDAGIEQFIQAADVVEAGDPGEEP